MIGRRQIPSIDGGLGRNQTDMLFLNDGVYGNFLLCLTENPPIPRVFSRGRYSVARDRQAIHNDPLRKYSIWGPTCDSVDCINKSCELPGEVRIGDWLYYENMGGTVVSLCQSGCMLTGFLSLHERDLYTL